MSKFKKLIIFTFLISSVFIKITYASGNFYLNYGLENRETDVRSYSNLYNDTWTNLLDLGRYT